MVANEDDFRVFFEHDSNVVLQFFVQRHDGLPFDLTGYTVALRVEGVGLFSCTVVEATAGRVEKVVIAQEIPNGAHKAQLRLDDGANIYHTNVFKLQVAEIVFGA